MPRVTPITPGAARCVVRFATAADEEASKWTQRFDFRWTGGAFVPIPDGSLSDLAAAVGTAFTDHFAAVLSSVYKVWRVDAYDLGDPSRAPQSDATATVGGGSADATPIDSALCVTIKTALIGRSYHGRAYFSGLEKEQLRPNGQAWEEDGVNACLDTADALGSLVTGTFKLGVLSLKHNGEYRATGLITDMTENAVRRVSGTVFAPLVSQRLRLESQRKRRRAA